jgi:hypothetical protein
MIVVFIMIAFIINHFFIIITTMTSQPAESPASIAVL